MKVKISKIILKNKIIAQLRVFNIPHIPRAWSLRRKNSATKVLFTNFKRKWVGGNSIYNFIIRYKLYIAVKNSESHSTFFYTIWEFHEGLIRSSHRSSSIKKLFLKILQISQEKNLCWCLFLNKATGTII